MGFDLICAYCKVCSLHVIMHSFCALIISVRAILIFYFDDIQIKVRVLYCLI